MARAMDQGFVYQGQHSRFRARRHGAPSAGLQPSRFVVFAQNHDQVGNRADGERLSVLVDPARLRLAAALVSLAPGIPLLFMGEEYAETAPFAYFVDHGDPDLTEAVRRGRAAEHGRAEGRPVGSRPTPRRSTGACSTGTSATTGTIGTSGCSTDRSWRSGPPSRPCGDPARSWTTAHAEGDVVTLTRSHAGTTIVALFNLSADEADGPAARNAIEALLLEGAAVGCFVSGGRRAGRAYALQPWQFRVFRATADGGAP